MCGMDISAGCRAETYALPSALVPFDCRNNRLADLALRTDGFADAVAAARDRYGPGRIAVVLGTSTSGVLSAEEAYRSRDTMTGILPPSFDYTHTHDMFSLDISSAAHWSSAGQQWSSQLPAHPAHRPSSMPAI